MVEMQKVACACGKQGHTLRTRAATAEEEAWAEHPGWQAEHNVRSAEDIAEQAGPANSAIAARAKGPSHNPEEHKNRRQSQGPPTGQQQSKVNSGHQESLHTALLKNHRQLEGSLPPCLDSSGTKMWQFPLTHWNPTF